MYINTYILSHIYATQTHTCLYTYIYIHAHMSLTTKCWKRPWIWIFKRSWRDICKSLEWWKGWENNECNYTKISKNKINNFLKSHCNKVLTCICSIRVLLRTFILWTLVFMKVYDLNKLSSICLGFLHKFYTSVLFCTKYSFLYFKCALTEPSQGSNFIGVFFILRKWMRVSTLFFAFWTQILMKLLDNELIATCF